jgi:hypothetical protein
MAPRSIIAPALLSAKPAIGGRRRGAFGLLGFWGWCAMGEVKHLCLVKFKEGVVVEDVLKGMTDLVAQMDMVKSFEWYTYLDELPFLFSFLEAHTAC